MGAKVLRCAIAGVARSYERTCRSVPMGAKPYSLLLLTGHCINRLD